MAEDERSVFEQNIAHFNVLNERLATLAARSREAPPRHQELWRGAVMGRLAVNEAWLKAEPELVGFFRHYARAGEGVQQRETDSLEGLSEALAQGELSPSAAEDLQAELNRVKAYAALKPYLTDFLVLYGKTIEIPPSPSKKDRRGWHGDPESHARAGRLGGRQRSKNRMARAPQDVPAAPEANPDDEPSLFEGRNFKDVVGQYGTMGMEGLTFEIFKYACNGQWFTFRDMATTTAFFRKLSPEDIKRHSGNFWNARESVPKYLAGRGLQARWAKRPTDRPNAFKYRLIVKQA